MDISILEQSMASAVRYILDFLEDNIAIYFDELPENFYVPSLYFPAPRILCKKATLASYRSTILFQCWFMAKDDWAAQKYAIQIRDQLLHDGCTIPAVKKDGSVDTWHMRITEPEIKGIDRGIVQLSFDLKGYFSFNEEETEKVNKAIFTGSIKSDVLDQMWFAATEEQKKYKEVQNANKRE